MQSIMVAEAEVGGKTSNAYSATRDLQAAVCRRRFLTIVLLLHWLGELPHDTP